MEVSFLEKVSAGILISIVGWLLTNVITFYVRKYRLSSAIISDINYHLSGVMESKDFVKRMLEINIVEGRKIEYAAYFNREEYDLYKTMQQDIIKYFGKTKLIKIIKFYKSFWELEVLIDGFMKDVAAYKTQNKALTKEDVEFMKSKANRIIRLSEIVTQREIRSINDLPEDYRGRITPDTLVK